METEREGFCATRLTRLRELVECTEALALILLLCLVQPSPDVSKPLETSDSSPCPVYNFVALGFGGIDAGHVAVRTSLSLVGRIADCHEANADGPVVDGSNGYGSKEPLVRDVRRQGL